MRLKDPKLKKLVDVVDKDCFTRSCYWARPDPGSFTQGQGYSQRSSGNKEWLCGRREINGCPSAGICENINEDGTICRTHYIENQRICGGCHQPLTTKKVVE